MSSTFVDACLTGDAHLRDVDDWTDRWHEGDGGELRLPEYLGLSDDEYALWVERPESLRFVIAARTRETDVMELLARTGELAHAARAEDAAEAHGVLDWLRTTGRI